MDGPPGRTRTCNLRLRRPLHYPVVLRAERAKYPTPEQWGQVKWCAGRPSGSGGAHHAGEHGAHTLIQQCLGLNRAIKKVEELVGLERGHAVPHRPDLRGEMQEMTLKYENQKTVAESLENIKKSLQVSHEDM